MPLAFYTLELCGSLVGFVVTDIQIFIAHNNIFIAYEYHLQTDSFSANRYLQKMDSEHAVSMVVGAIQALA